MYFFFFFFSILSDSLVYCAILPYDRQKAWEGGRSCLLEQIKQTNLTWSVSYSHKKTELATKEMGWGKGTNGSDKNMSPAKTKAYMVFGNLCAPVPPPPGQLLICTSSLLYIYIYYKSGYFGCSLE